MPGAAAGSDKKIIFRGRATKKGMRLVIFSMKQVYYLVGCFCLGSFHKATAQPAVQDSLYSRSVNHVLDTYRLHIAQNLLLYTGSEYTFSGHGATGSPFFDSPALLPGTVYYNGKPYYNVLLHYDLTTDDLIINDYTQNHAIKLVREKIDSFFIRQHKFVRMYPDSLHSFTGTGFYESLFEGKVSVLAKREKKFQLSLNAADKTAGYLSYDNYFIKKEEQLFTIHNKASILPVLGDKKAQVKEFIKKNRLDFKKDRERAVVQTVCYYSGLKN